MAGFSQTNKRNETKANTKAIHALVDKAVWLHKAGQLEEAEALYLQALNSGFEHEIILSNLGLIYKRSNRIDQAIRIYERAIRLNPQFADSHANLGGLLQEKCEYERAQQSLHRAIRLNPQHAVAHSNLGLALQAQGNNTAALKCALESIRLNPRLASTYTNLGTIYKAQGQLEQAAAATQRAIKLDPTYIPAYLSLATISREQGNLDDALSIVVDAQKLKPNYAPTFVSLGNILKDMGRLDNALDATKQAVELDPSNAAAHVNLGIMLHGQDKLDEAWEATQKAISLDPNNAMAHRSLGAICRDKGDMKAALSATSKSIELNPSDAVAYMNLGCVYTELCEHERAEIYLQKAVAMDPNNTGAMVNLSQLQLRQHDYRNGWQNYRVRKERMVAHVNGEESCISTIDQIHPSDGILIAGDQGIGDQILFASLLPELQLICKRLFVTVDKRLLTLYRRSFSGNIEFYPKHTNLPNLSIDNFVSMGDLGALLRKEKADFARQPSHYLTADAKKTESIATELRSGNSKRVIGLSWHSSGSRYFNRKKSIAMANLAPMLSQLNAELVKLQYGNCQDDITYAHDHHSLTIRELPGLDVTNNIDGLASLIAVCDAVVTISNVTAHLAAALGKPTHLLCPASPHFYWGLDASSTVWYPTVKIYRQSKDGDWQPALHQLINTLYHSGFPQLCKAPSAAATTR